MNIIEKEECIYCKYYEQDMPSYEEGGKFWCSCLKNNNDNLKGFPFKNKLKCFEIDNNLYILNK